MTSDIDRAIAEQAREREQLAAAKRGPVSAPNAELAYAVLDHIDAHPEQWDQGVWIGKAECGTVACFAGWVCLLAGDLPAFEAGPKRSMLLMGGTPVPDRAEELLRASRFPDDVFDDDDFNDELQRNLFADSNTLDELGDLVEEIFGPRPGGAA